MQLREREQLFRGGQERLCHDHQFIGAENEQILPKDLQVWLLERRARLLQVFVYRELSGANGHDEYTQLERALCFGSDAKLTGRQPDR